MRQQLEAGRAVTNVTLYRSVVEEGGRRRRSGRRTVQVAEVAGMAFGEVGRGRSRRHSWTEFVASESLSLTAMATTTAAATKSTAEEMEELAKVRPPAGQYRAGLNITFLQEM